MDKIKLAEFTEKMKSTPVETLRQKCYDDENFISVIIKKDIMKEDNKIVYYLKLAKFDKYESGIIMAFREFDSVDERNKFIKYFIEKNQAKETNFSYIKDFLSSAGRLEHYVKFFYHFW